MVEFHWRSRRWSPGRRWSCLDATRTTKAESTCRSTPAALDRLRAVRLAVLDLRLLRVLVVCELVAGVRPAASISVCRRARAGP